MIYQVIFFICTALVFSGNGQSLAHLSNLVCHPRPAVVETKPSFYPYFVSLHRCNGSKGVAPPSVFRCVPKKTEDVVIGIMSNSKAERLILKNHTECVSECATKREDCKHPNVFNPQNCSCNCHHASPPSDIGACPSDRKWDSSSCSCQCKGSKTCDRRFVYDSNTCSCKCNPKRKVTCESMNGIFIPETCKCKRAKRQISPGEKRSDSFVGSTTFWIYVLIGEGVFLLICFDVILFFKKMGVLYRITRRCREKGAAMKSQENFDAVAPPKKLKAHCNDVCDSAFSSLQNVSKTVDLTSVVHVQKL